jgi:hypothetical protein
MVNSEFHHSSVWTSVTLTDPSPEEISGPLAINLEIQVDADGDLYIGAIILTTTN